MRKPLIGSVLVCVTLAVSSRASAQEGDGASRVHPWSVGVGMGLLSVPSSGFGLFMPAGFVSVERGLGGALVLDARLGGHYSESKGDYDARSVAAHAALGPRVFFVPRGPVRPSAYLHAAVTYAREELDGYPDASVLAFGPELGAGIDADLAEAVVLRLESSLASFQRARVRAEEDRAEWVYGLGLVPRAELRIGF